MRSDSYRRLLRLDDVLEGGRRAQHAAGALRAPGELLLAHELIEKGEVLVQPEHVRNRLRQLRDDAARDRLDAQLPPACGDSHRARAARNGQGRLERAPGEIDPVGRQLCDSVRDDCAREVDRLAACASKQKLCDAHILSLPKVRMPATVGARRGAVEETAGTDSGAPRRLS
jgi:hypothetical protein